jgi:adenine-specific DNA-methyltransferase
MGKQLALEGVPRFEFEMPSTRYQGSKEKLAEWIWSAVGTLKFQTFLDAFGGTGSVAFWAKRYGKQVFYNDLFRSNYYMGLALIENASTVLTPEDVEFLLSRHSLNYSTFIQNRFKGVFYTDEENAWLDVVVRNIAELNQYKKALALSALFQACLVKRPYNLFHRANLYMRFADVKRGFGNKSTWDTPFPTHFKKYVSEYNAAIFSNGQENHAYNLDVLSIPNPESYDVVYLDPPYFSSQRGPTDYCSYYHFLEGLCVYVEKGAGEWDNLMDHRRKMMPFKHETSLAQKANVWMHRETVLDALDAVFKKFEKSVLVVSYNSDGFPPEAQMVSLLKKYKANVTVERRKYRYALRSEAVDELLFIAV